MQLRIECQVGNQKFQIIENAESEREAWKAMAFWQSMPRKCGKCDSTNLRFEYRNPQNFDYYSVYCNACAAELKFGQRKEDNSLFAKTWEEARDANANPGEPNGNAHAAAPAGAGAGGYSDPNDELRF